ncbi:MAG: transketolase, partial [Bacteriovoracia bacterium]
MSSDSLDSLCINTIRTLSIDAIQKANSGHPGLPLGAAPMAHVLWDRFLKHDPKRPDWADRDRFVLSAGHGSMLLYSLLHLYGYDLSLDEIKAFRQWGSKTPGHPEFGLTPGVEATTGPLGQGSVNAIGMAMAERSLAHLFNRPGFEIVNHYTYALVSDGDLMEGISAEGASLAGHLKLGKLIYLYDANDVTLDGPTSLTFSTENVARRYESYDWHVQTVKDGDRDLKALHQAIENARQDTTKPSLIIIKTTIGFGSPNKAGKSSVHGSQLGPEELVKTK